MLLSNMFVWSLYFFIVGQATPHYVDYYTVLRGDPKAVGMEDSIGCLDVIDNTIHGYTEEEIRNKLKIAGAICIQEKRILDNLPDSNYK